MDGVWVISLPQPPQPKAPVTNISPFQYSTIGSDGIGQDLSWDENVLGQFTPTKQLQQTFRTSNTTITTTIQPQQQSHTNTTTSDDTSSPPFPFQSNNRKKYHNHTFSRHFNGYHPTPTGSLYITMATTIMVHFAHQTCNILIVYLSFYPTVVTFRTKHLIRPHLWRHFIISVVSLVNRLVWLTSVSPIIIMDQIESRVD